MDNLAFINGKILRESNISISCRDLGLLRGYGVFDFMTAKGTKIYLYSEHYNRFINSAKGLNLKPPYSKNKLRKIIEELLLKNNFNESTIRVVLTGGISPNNRNIERETILILIDKFNPYPKEFYKCGVKAITREFHRDIPYIKALNYQFAFSLYQTNTITNAFEIIYVSNNKVLEGATSNIFVLKNSQLITPKENILLGITRNTVIDIAKINGWRVEERDISSNELFDADEVFITATTKKIMPISHIDGKKVGKVCPGPITQKLLEIYNDCKK